jgi:hypothetical protein
VAVSPDKFAVIKFPVYELEKRSPFPRSMGKPLVKRFAHRLRAGPFLIVGDDETQIERGMV